MDMNNKKSSVEEIINSLTTDEDLRQDLWVSYLEGTHPTRLSSKILQILITCDTQGRFPIVCPPDFLLNKMNNLESHVLYLLCLGYNIGKISVALSISRVAVLETMSSIRKKNTLD